MRRTTQPDGPMSHASNKKEEKGNRMTERNTLSKRLAASVGAFTLATMGLLGTGVANAAPGPGQEGAYSTGTLTVHKYAGTTTSNTKHNGQELDSVSRPPLDGVTFAVTRVGELDDENECVAIPLTTDAGWVRATVAAATAPAAPASPFCLTDDVQTGVTADGGVYEFEGLDLGLYFVNETAAPEGVTPAVKFYVTIPFPTGDAVDSPTDWLYDVHVYPKNDLEGAGSKTVADPGAHGLGSIVPWTITTRPLGSFGAGAPLTSYQIIDALVAQLRYEATTSLQVKSPAGVLSTVDAGYYQITPAAPATAPGGRVVVNFTEDGIDWLNTLPAGTTFQWDLTTKVVGVGELENKALENTGDEDVEIGGATTDWGQAEILKFDGNDDEKFLAGAVFRVFDVNAETNTCEGDLGAAIEVNGEVDFTTGDNGIATIAGLYVGKNGDSQTRDYCVVETVPPAGYVIDETPRLIRVAPGITADLELEFENQLRPGPDLPMTGGMGTAVFGGTGLALVVVAVAAGLSIRRKQTAK